MAEYIEREAIHSIIERTSTFAFIRDGMHEQVDSLPAADVVEVRHGRWIKHEGYYECSECHAKSIMGYNYCHSCGARMDKEGKQ